LSFLALLCGFNIIFGGGGGINLVILENGTLLLGILDCGTLDCGILETGILLLGDFGLWNFTSWNCASWYLRNRNFTSWNKRWNFSLGICDGKLEDFVPV